MLARQPMFAQLELATYTAISIKVAVPIVLTVNYYEGARDDGLLLYSPLNSELFRRNSVKGS